MICLARRLPRSLHRSLPGADPIQESTKEPTQKGASQEHTQESTQGAAQEGASQEPTQESTQEAAQEHFPGALHKRSLAFALFKVTRDFVGEITTALSLASSPAERQEAQDQRWA